MKKINLIFALLLILSYGVISAQSFTAEPGSSVLEWAGKKVTGEHYGTIELKSGTLILENGRIKSGKFIIDMTSIVCTDLEDAEYNKKLVGHLMSDDFFGTTTYPTASFVFKKALPISGDFYTVYGDLTIKEITHPVKFKINQSKTDEGIKILGAVTVDRTKYNIKYGSGKFFEELGDNMIHDEFIVKLDILATE